MDLGKIFNGRKMKNTKVVAIVVAVVVVLIIIGIGLMQRAPTPTPTPSPTPSPTAPATTTPPPEEVTKVVLQLNWAILGDHAPYFVAEELGYYKQNHLEVEIIRGYGSADTAKSVAAGTADFGVADAGSVISVIGRGGRIKILYVIFDKCPFCMWTRKDTGIQTPMDLPGHTIGTPPGDAQRIMFPALAKKVGIDPDSVTFVNIDPGAKYSALAAGTVDAVFDYYTGKPFMEKAVGKENLVYALWADYGIEMYGNSMITSDKMLEEHPDVVKRFVNATLAAWSWTIEHPEEAIRILAKYHPEIDVESYTANLYLCLDLIKTERFIQHGMGWISDEIMNETVTLVKTYLGPFEYEFTVEDVYTKEAWVYYPVKP